MRKKSLKSFLSVLLSVFTISCSLQSITVGNVSLILPSRANGDGSSTMLNVELVNNKNIVYSETTSKTDLLIKNIPIGHYLLKISGQDYAYNYYGEKEVDVVADKTVGADVEVKKDLVGTEVSTFADLKTKIEDLNGPDVISISANLNTDKLTKGIVVNRNVTIKTAPNVGNVRILRKKDLATTEPLFSVEPNVTLTIQGRSDSNIVLDGGSNESDAVTCKAPFIRAYGNLSLEYCFLQNNNNTEKGTTKYLYGGAIYCGINESTQATSPEVHQLKFNHVTIKNITTVKVGAVYVFNSTNFKTSISINNSTFEANKIDQGALHLYNSSKNAEWSLSATVSNSVIQNNKAQSHGGGIYVDNSILTINNTSIKSNSTGAAGGGMYIKGTLSEIVIDNIEQSINHNEAKTNSATGKGGGINIQGGKLSILHGSISENTAYGNGGNGNNLYAQNCIVNDKEITSGTGEDTEVGPTTYK